MVDRQTGHSKRIANEAEFWDRSASRPTASFRRSLYGELSRRLSERLVEALEDARGKRILYVGCGQSSRVAYDLAERGAEVWCADVSFGSLRKFMGHPFGPLRPAVRPVVADVERLPFSDGLFDAAIGKAIVHHLDIPVFLKELSRVCVPGAKVVFVEPLGMNPAIGLFRRLTPGMRVPTEHPLRPADIGRFREVCASVDLRYSECLAVLAYPLFLLRMRRLGRLVHRALSRCDAALLRLPTPIRWMAWVVTIAARMSPTPQTPSQPPTTGAGL